MEPLLSWEKYSVFNFQLVIHLAKPTLQTFVRTLLPSSEDWQASGLGQLLLIMSTVTGFF